MTAEILNFTGITKGDIPPQAVLEGAMEMDLNEVVAVGYNSKGEFYFASSVGDIHRVLYLLEKAKKAIMEMED